MIFSKFCKNTFSKSNFFSKMNELTGVFKKSKNLLSRIDIRDLRFCDDSFLNLLFLKSKIFEITNMFTLYIFINNLILYTQNNLVFVFVFWLWWAQPRKNENKHPTFFHPTMLDTLGVRMSILFY